MTAIPIILNPTAGGGRLLAARPRLDEAARAVGVRLEWWFTDHRGHGTELAARAAREGRPLVIAYGGDGSYNEVARGLHGSASALGVLPGGTVSVLVYELGLARAPEVALAALVRGRDRDFPVGRTDADEVVLLMVSAGPDSMVLEHLRPGLKRRFGRAGIALQAVLEARRRPPLVEVTAGDRRERGSWVIVGNCRRYAGDHLATPGADPFSPGFEVVVERARSRWGVAAFALAMALGSHQRRRSVVSFAATAVTLGAVDPAVVRYQVDGDLAGALPVTVRVDPVPVRLRVPVGVPGASIERV